MAPSGIINTGLCACKIIMKFETIADVYSANEKARENLNAVISGISEEEASALPEGEKWTIGQIVEHLSMVDFGISRICAKLLEGAKAAGKPSAGTINLSSDFREKLTAVGSVKVEAPERVQPTGTVSIAQRRQRL